eukprot:1529887-Alexandrium_andersonii.AAC.1
MRTRRTQRARAGATPCHLRRSRLLVQSGPLFALRATSISCLPIAPKGVRVAGGSSGAKRAGHSTGTQH